MTIASFRNEGRMGNFLYESACVFGYSKKHGIDFSVPSRTRNPIWSPIYLQHLVHPNYVNWKEDVLLNETWNRDQHFQEIPFNKEWEDGQIILNGFFQSYKYFDFCREEMLEAFAFPWELKKGVVSIHCRRGDYLLHPTKHPVITIEYLRQAVEIFRDKKGINKFKFFSDDITWCLQCGIAQMFPDCEFEYSVGQNEVQDLIEMSCHEHQICSNSTLAIWGAELNRNPRKVVVVPSESNWFGPDNNLSVKDLFRPEWIQVSY